MNRIRFALSADDLIAAQRLYQMAGIRRTALLLLIALAFALYLATRLSDPTDRLLLAIAVAAVLFSRVGVPLYMRFIGIPRMARRALAQDPGLAEPSELGWDDTAIWAESPSSSWKQPVSDFKAWLADEQVLLLFRQTHLFHTLPARAFADPAQREALIATLTANGVTNTWPPR